MLMKNHPHRFAIALIILMSLAVPLASFHAQTAAKLLKPLTGVGAPFGARDPLHCDSTKEPASGAPSSEQVKAYFISGFEHAKGTGTLAELYLAEDVKVEIGKGRPFESGDGSGDIDTHELVYPIRGSYNWYLCYPITSVNTAGKNCVKFGQPNAEGLCYKTTFGDWRCSMSDIQTRKTFPGYFAAPK